MRWDEARTCAEGVDVLWEKCAGRAAAVEAARRMLVENAQKFDVMFSVEAQVRCELEWAPSPIDH
jgi:hypothetical protein